MLTNIARREANGTRALLTAAALMVTPVLAHANATINLGTAAPYTVFGLSNTVVNLSAVTINGNVGVSYGGDLKLMAPSTINGNVYLSTGATESANAGTLNGTLFTGQNLVSADQSALSLSSSSLGMGTTMASPGNLTTALTINGNGGVNVIDFSSISLNNVNLTLNGGPNDLFYLNVTNGFSLVGTAAIVETGSVTPLQVLINVVGTGNTISTAVGDQVDGILLAPLRSGNLDGTFDGKLIFGGGTLGLLSQALVNDVPEPSALALFGLGLLACFRRLRRSE